MASPHVGHIHLIDLNLSVIESRSFGTGSWAKISPSTRASRCRARGARLEKRERERERERGQKLNKPITVKGGITSSARFGLFNAFAHSAQRINLTEDRKRSSAAREGKLRKGFSALIRTSKHDC